MEKMLLGHYCYCGSAFVVFVLIVSSSGLLQCEKRVKNLEKIQLCKNPREVRILDFRNNRISSILDDTFSTYTSVTDLCLSNTSLSGISSDIFRGMDSLETIHLSDNKIESLNKNSFGKIPNLKQVHLNNNVISNINEATFYQLPKLRYIFIRNNTVSIVDKNIFPIDNIIYRVDFALNSLTNISFIRNLIHVEVLDLPHNKIETLDSNNFENLIDLRYLDLKYNLIKQLPINLLVHQRNLIQVDLSHNQLIQIETGTFNVGFRDLLLNDNKISTIGVLNNISEINLNGNRLEELSTLPKNPVKLYIDDNLWNCDFIYILTGYSNIILIFTIKNNEKNIQGVPCQDKNKSPGSINTIYKRTEDIIINKSFWNPETIIIIIALFSVIITSLMIAIYFKKQKQSIWKRNYSSTHSRGISLSNLDKWSASATENGYLTPKLEERIYEEIF